MTLATPNLILLVGASPSDQAPLLLSVEFDTIESSVRQGAHRHDLQVARSQNTLAAELVPDLLHHAPALVHFSGHGRERGELIFENANGTSAPLSTGLLSAVFAAFSETTRCVVLNACWSDEQAKTIEAHIPAVVGMTRKVSDLAALSFSSTFYLALAEGKSVSEAFSLAVLQLQLAAPGDADAPMLFVKEGEGEVVLAGPGRHGAAHSASTGSPEREQLVTDLFTVHYGPLVRIASTLLDDTPGAEELVRSAFVDLLYEEPAPKPGDEPTWLRSHVMRSATSALNRQRVLEAANGGGAAAKRARVLAALRGLPSPQSEVLVLKHLGALDADQIGAVLDLPTASVVQTAAEGLDALGALLDEVAA